MLSTLVLGLLGAVSVLAHPVVESTGLEVRNVEARAVNGKVNMAYYGSWARYQNPPVTPYNIGYSQMTHIVYAFADIDPSTGVVESHDPWGDYQQTNEGETYVEGNAYGNIRELYTIKKHNRRIKTILSIGGWEISQKGGFQVAAQTAASRKRFADSAVQLMADFGMDGIDIDWEYPNTAAEGQLMLSLVRAVRTALDTYQTTLGQSYRYSLSVATPGASRNYNKMPIRTMHTLVDHFHIMTYDYAAPSWSPYAAHASATFLDKSNLRATPIVASQAVGNFRNFGVPSSKILLGLPLYGRSFANTDGAGKAFSGPGYTTPGLEAGVVPYKNLPRPGAKVGFSSALGASWTYDATKREFITFDNSGPARIKGQYIVSQGLGGAFFWEASQDRIGSRSLMKLTRDYLGGMDTTLNQLDYPTSRFENIQKKMPGSVSPN